jgi:hypothetical protein
LWACTSTTNVELHAQRRALDAWSDGQAAAEAGRHGEARQAFERALSARPGDPILLAWRAQAEAADGEPETAIATLDRVLDAQPDFAEARYQRAAYLARTGRPAEAGPDLRRALEDGAGSPRLARSDPDFRPFVDHDAFSFLPDSSLLVGIEPLPERAFRGSEVPVVATVRDLVDPAALRVEGLVRGPIDLRRSVEDWRKGPEGTTVSLRWDLVLTGVGPVVVGPMSFRVDGEQHTSGAATMQAVGPEGEAEAEPQRWRLASATVHGAGLDLDRPVSSGERVFVRTDVTSQVTTIPPGQVLARHERRVDGQPEWIVWELGPVKKVEVRGAGGERFAGPPAPPPPPK